MKENRQLEEVVKLAKQGDPSAFERLYGLTYQYTYFHAKAILNNEEDVWDLIQEVYITVYNKLDTLREDALIKPWIGGIVFNLGHKRLRKKTETLLEEGQEYLFENIEVKDCDILPEEAIDQKETVEIIKDIVEKLPPLQKAAVIAYYFDEKEVSMIARETGCSEGTIKSRLNYARKTIKDQIEKKEKEMGVSMHMVTTPLLYYALREMFRETKVPQQMAADALKKVENFVGIISIESGMEPLNDPVLRDTSGMNRPIGKLMEGAGRNIVAKICMGCIAGAVAVSGGILGASVAHRSEKVGDTIPVELVVESKTAVETDSGEIEKKQSSPESAMETTVNYGWEEYENSWKYRLEDGSYICHEWQEIDDELYYFKKDGTIAVDHVYLGHQLYLFDAEGKLTGISYVDDNAFYDEDIKYYGGNGVNISYLDGTKSRELLSDQGVQKIWVEGDKVCYFCNEEVCWAYKKGSEIKRIHENGWFTVIDLIASGTNMYMSYTDVTEGDGDIPHGQLVSIREGQQDIDVMPTPEGDAEFKQLQEYDNWIYYLHSNRVPELNGGVAYKNVLYRSSNLNSEPQRMTDEGIDAFFVYGDKIYYMQAGELKWLKSSEIVVKTEGTEEIKKDSEQVFSEFVESNLIPQYGKMTELSGQYFYEYLDENIYPKVFPSSLIPGEPVLQTGIIASYIDDWDMDGQKELAVFYSKQNNDGKGGTIELQIYEMSSSNINLQGKYDLGEMISGFSDSGEFKIFLKKDKEGTIFGFWDEVRSCTYGDGTWNTVNFVKYHDAYIHPVQKIVVGTGETDDNRDYAAELRALGFYVSADTTGIGSYELYISDDELDCQMLIKGNYGIKPQEDNDKANNIRRNYLDEMDMYGNFKDHPIVWKIEVY